MVQSLLNNKSNIARFVISLLRRGNYQLDYYILRIRLVENESNDKINIPLVVITRFTSHLST